MRVFGVLVVLVLLYAVGGFWLAPRIIRSQLLKRLPPITHRQAEIGNVEVNPFRLTLTISNLALIESNGARCASFERLHADLQAESLWRRALVLREVEVIRPVLDVRRNPQGVFSWADLVPTNSSATSAPPPLVEITSLRLGDGQVNFHDEIVPGGFERRLSEIDLQFTNFTTKLGVRSAGTFKTVGEEGESVRWEGDVGVNPVASVGTLNIEGYSIPRYGPYVQLATVASFTEGRLNVILPYSFLNSGNSPDATVSNVAVTITNLVFKLPDATEPTLTLAELAIQNVSAGLKEQRLQVGQIALRSGQFTAQRGSDGSVDVKQAVRPEFVERAIQTIGERLAGWRVQVDEILNEKIELGWKDIDVASPVLLTAEVERLQVKGLSNQTNQPVTIDGVGRWATNGRMNLAIEGTLLPARATVKLDFERIRLARLQPYFSELVNLDVRQGEVAGHWTVGYNREVGGPLVTVEGGLEVTDFLAFDTQVGRDFLKWETVALRRVKGSWEPAKLELDEIYLRAPATSFVLMTNGQFNVFSLLKASKSQADVKAPTPEPPVAPASMAVSLNVNRITLTNASLLAADQTVPGEFTTTLQRFSGSVTDVAYPEMKKSRIDLAGFVGARAPFKVEGWVRPDPAQMLIDLHVTATNAEVIPFTPYSIKFAGYPLKEGKVTADVRYQVNGRQLEGENKVIVDRLTLGSKTSGEPILNLPVKLGIAILKDSEGKITLDIPVKGSLDDPEFGVRKVIWQAVKGLFVKVATAPFKLLGSLFGGTEEDGESLQTVSFDAGSTNLAPASTNQLHQLVKALGQRPELLLALRGGASPTNDGPVLARRKLDATLAQLRAEELAATGSPAAQDAGTTLSRTDRSRLLAKSFAQKFPEIALANPTPEPAPGAPNTTNPLPLSPEEMERKLLAQLDPSEEELNALRSARVVTVKEWLLASGLSPDRLVSDEAATSASNTPAAPAEPPVLESVVEFSLE